MYTNTCLLDWSHSLCCQFSLKICQLSNMCINLQLIKNMVQFTGREEHVVERRCCGKLSFMIIPCLMTMKVLSSQKYVLYLGLPTGILILDCIG